MPSPTDAANVPPAGRDPAVDRALRELGCASADELEIGGMTARALAERFGTPLYAFAADVLDRRLAAVRDALGPRIDVLWSVKANPSVAVTERLRRGGAGAEIASLGELHVAAAAGHRAGDLRFAGPGKTDAEIAAALDLGLGCFHVESASEARAVAAAARARGRRAGVAVRVNPEAQAAGSRLRMAGAGSRFGVDVGQVRELVRWLAAEPAVELRGLHLYAGTQCFDAGAFVRQAASLCELAASLERELGIALRELDLGGGFGVAAYAGDPEFDLAAAAAGVRDVVARHDRGDRRWFVELGRWLAAPAGVYLARVVRTKTSSGIAHAVLDGGLHHFAAAAGVGTVLRRPPLLVAATALRAPPGPPLSLGGPLCTPADQFAEAAPLPPLREGDLVAVLHAGAYGLTFSPTGFLSHPTPPEVLAEAGAARVVRARGEVTDVLRGQAP